MEWKTVKLGDCLSKIIDNRGKTPKDLVPSGHPLLEINAVSKNNKYPLYGEAKKYVDDVVYSTWFRSGHPQYGDILVPTVGTLGAVAYVDRNDCCIAQNLIALRANTDLCDSAYIYYVLCNPQIVKRLLNLDIGAVQASIKVPHLLALEIPLPPLETQRRIAAILSSLDAKIENNNRINRNLEAQAQALFKSWFVDFEPFGEKMPEDWKEYQLSELADVIGGYSYKGAELMPSEDAMATIKNFDRKGYFKLEGYKEIQISGRFKNTQILNLFDVIVAHTDITQQADIIGNPAIILSKGGYRNIIMSMDLCKVQPTHYAISSAFLYCLLKDSRFKSHALGYVNGTTVLHMSKKALPEYKVFLPSDLSKVQELGDQLQNLYKRCSVNLEENQRLAALRDTLLPKLMKGEIAV